jgi:hypothetical protein
MTKGICIIALNHPYYGNYASQLAASIKFSSPDISITLLHDKKGIGHLNSDRLSLFEHIIEMPLNSYTVKGRNEYLKSKSFLYELTPYDETIYLDADIIWLPRKPITELFEAFKDINFTMSNRGFIDIYEAKNGFISWANPADIIKEYDVVGLLYNLSSEFIYFKKCKEVESLFLQTQKNFDDMKINHVQFGSGIPDELPFTIAMLQTGIYPHVTPFLPCYWEAFMKKNMPATEMYLRYYAYSLGGAIQSKKIIDFYNNLAQFYCNKFGLGKYFPLMSKRNFLPERTNI